MTRDPFFREIYSVLVIDDDPIDLFLSEKFIRLSGTNWKVETASNGLEGLKLINHNFLEGIGLPELILVDLYMPIMDGLSFLEGFDRTALPGKNFVKIVVLTISHDHQKNHELIRKGAHCVIHKPLDMTELRKCLNSEVPSLPGVALSGTI